MVKGIKVKLRQKSISNNRVTLYLDFYPAIIHPETGKPSRREFLGYYLFEKPKNHIDKLHNKETLEIAQSIRQKRENELNKPEIYTGYEKEQLRKHELGAKNFLEFYMNLANKKTGSTKAGWLSSYNYLVKFTNGSLIFAQLTEKYCSEFKDFLLTTNCLKNSTEKLSQNSASSCFNKFKVALKIAYKEDYLAKDLNSKIPEIPIIETIKTTLTIEELNKIANIHFENELCKRAVLFAAITGMPFMELKNLCWGNIDNSESLGTKISTRRQKTQKPYYANISKQAYELLGETKEPSDKVFLGLSDKERYQDFRLLLATAGIKKKMTFHDLRHTYATLQLELGTELATLKDSMNHQDIKQTLHYIKISNPKKRASAEVIELTYSNLIAK